MALGLNLRNDSAILKPSLKETRYRLWWALYALDYLLCDMTGRPSFVPDGYCATPLPAWIEDDDFDTEVGQQLLSSESQKGVRKVVQNIYTINCNTSRTHEASKVTREVEQPQIPASLQYKASLNLEYAAHHGPPAFFLQIVQLGRLMQNVRRTLYSSQAVGQTWTAIHSSIEQFDEQLEGWYDALPSTFSHWNQGNSSESLDPLNFILACHFYGSKITIHRHCLTKLPEEMSDNFASLRRFHEDSAVKCIQAATDNLQISLDLDVTKTIENGPWWNILHWIVQACTVLLLKLSDAPYSDADDCPHTGWLEKAVQWLHTFGKLNPSALRAWAVCSSTLNSLKQRTESSAI